MTKTNRLIASGACAMFILAACQTTGPHSSLAQGSDGPSAFIEAACGGCHSVEPQYQSPNPAAPTFEAIANRDGLTADTLGAWLKDAHNYPEFMDFDLEEEQAEDIAAYMVTLRSDDYTPDQ